MEASLTQGSKNGVSCLQTGKVTGTQRCPQVHGRSLGKCLQPHCLLLSTDPPAMEPVLSTLDSL